MNRGASLLTQILSSFNEDSQWQKLWTSALINRVTDDNLENIKVINQWKECWREPSERAIEALRKVLLVGER